MRVSRERTCRASFGAVGLVNCRYLEHVAKHLRLGRPLPASARHHRRCSFRPPDDPEVPRDCESGGDYGVNTGNRYRASLPLRPRRGEGTARRPWRQKFAPGHAPVAAPLAVSPGSDNG